MFSKHARTRRLRVFITSPTVAVVGFILLLGFIIYLVFFTGLIKKNVPDTQITIIDPSPSINLQLISYQTDLASRSAQFFVNESQQIAQPAFQIVTIDRQGNLVDQSNATASSLPVLVDQNLPAQNSLRNIYVLFNLLPEIGLGYSQVWVAPNRFCVLFDSSLLVIFPLDRDPATSLRALQQIRSQSKINLESSIIDLRFDKPVVSPFE